MTDLPISVIIPLTTVPILYMKTLLILAVSLFFLATPIHAQENTNNCRPLFGGGPTCVQSGNIMLDKKIKNSRGFADQLEVTEDVFTAGQTVVFELHTKNLSNRAIDKVLITDIMPQYVSYSKGPGSYNRESNILTYTIEKLEAGQTHTAMVEAKIVAQNDLPQTTGTICVINQATATQGRNSSSDNTQFCIQTLNTQVALPQNSMTRQSGTPPVLPTPQISTAPKTGPEMFALIGLIPLAGTGIYLRRKTWN